MGYKGLIPTSGRPETSHVHVVKLPKACTRNLNTKCNDSITSEDSRFSTGSSNFISQFSLTSNHLEWAVFH